MKYSEKLKDPRWQKLRLKILERDKWTCQSCTATEHTLHVHHCYYKIGLEPWEYPEQSLITLCDECHWIENDSRNKLEQTLLFSCKEKFLWSEIETLGMAIHYMAMTSTQTTIVDAIAWFFENPEAQAKIIKLHKKYKKEQKGKRRKK